MSYSTQEFFNLNGTYTQYHGSEYTPSGGAGTQVIERGLGEYSNQPAPVDFVNWEDWFLTSVVPSDSLAQSSANLPATLLQNCLSPGTRPHSYLEDVIDSSRNLPVAAPVPVPHAARTKAALRTMLSFGDKGSVYLYSSEKKLNWHE